MWGVDILFFCFKYVLILTCLCKKLLHIKNKSNVLGLGQSEEGVVVCYT